MLRRKPTRQQLDQADIDDLDRLRAELRKASETATALGNAINPPVLDKTARDKAIHGLSARERIGLASDKGTEAGKESRAMPPQ